MTTNINYNTILNEQENKEKESEKMKTVISTAMQRSVSRHGLRMGKAFIRFSNTCKTQGEIDLINKLIISCIEKVSSKQLGVCVDRSSVE